MDTINKIFQWESSPDEGEAEAPVPGRTPHGRRGKPEQGTKKTRMKDETQAARKRMYSAANKAQEQKPKVEKNKKAKRLEHPGTQDTTTGMTGMDRVREPIEQLFDWDKGDDISSSSGEEGTPTDWSAWLPAAMRRKKPVHVSGFCFNCLRCGWVRCGWVRCGAVRCGAVRCGAVRCGAVRCGAVRCGAVRCGAVRCGAVRCGAVRCGAVRCATKTVLSRKGN